MMRLPCRARRRSGISRQPEVAFPTAPWIRPPIGATEREIVTDRRCALFAGYAFGARIANF